MCTLSSRLSIEKQYHLHFINHKCLTGRLVGIKQNRGNSYFVTSKLHMTQTLWPQCALRESSYRLLSLQYSTDYVCIHIGLYLHIPLHLLGHAMNYDCSDTNANDVECCRVATRKQFTANK